MAEEPGKRPEYLFIQGHDEMLVKISLKDGMIEFGPNFTQDEASRVFWKAIEAYGRQQLAQRAQEPKH